MTINANEKKYIRGILGLRIEMHRKQKNWSQEDLAERLGIERTSVTNIEAGRQGVSVERLIELAGLFKVRPASLLKGIND